MSRIVCKLPYYPLDRWCIYQRKQYKKARYRRAEERRSRWFQKIFDEMFNPVKP